MNIEKLQRFRHDSRGVHEDQGGDYLWYDDVVTLIEEDKKERERCVEVLKSAIGLKVERKRASHPMDSLKSRLAESENGGVDDLASARSHLSFQESIPDNDPDCIASARERVERAEKAEVMRLKLANYTRMENDMHTLRADYRTIHSKCDALESREVSLRDENKTLKSRLAELEGITERLYQAAKSGHVTAAVAMDLVDGLIAYEAYKDGKK